MLRSRFSVITVRKGCKPGKVKKAKLRIETGIRDEKE
jgi:hypothetical protein